MAERIAIRVCDNCTRTWCDCECEKWKTGEVDYVSMDYVIKWLSLGCYGPQIIELLTQQRLALQKEGDYLEEKDKAEGQEVALEEALKAKQDT